MITPQLYNRDNGDVSIPFFLAPDLNNDIRVIAAGGSTPSATSTPSSKVMENVFDQYFYHQLGRGPFAAIFFQCLTHCFGVNAMKALIDICHELQKNPVTDLSKAKKLAVTRVSAQQRGGVWIVGKRLFTGQCLYVVVNQCSNFYDVMDIVDQVVRDINKR